MTYFLSEICKKEGIRCELDTLKEIYRVTDGDLRGAINLLQSATGGGEGAITVERVRSLAGDVSLKTVREIIDSGTEGNYIDARKRLFDYMNSLGLSGFDIIRLIMGALSEAGKLSPEIAEVLAEYDYRLIEGANEDIQLSALLAHLVKMMRVGG